MSSQGPELWLITQVYPSVPAQFADPPLVKCWQLLLSFFSEEKNEYISHDTRLEVLPVPQEGDLGDLGVRSISSPFLLYKEGYQKAVAQSNHKGFTCESDCPLACRI